MAPLEVKRSGMLCWVYAIHDDGRVFKVGVGLTKRLAIKSLTRVRKNLVIVHPNGVLQCHLPVTKIDPIVPKYLIHAMAEFLGIPLSYSKGDQCV